MDRERKDIAGASLSQKRDPVALRDAVVKRHRGCRSEFSTSSSRRMQYRSSPKRADREEELHDHVLSRPWLRLRGLLGRLPGSAHIIGREEPDQQITSGWREPFELVEQPLAALVRLIHENNED